MSLLISENFVSLARVKKLATYAKKNANYGAYVEVTECTIKSGDNQPRFDIKVYQDKTKVDRYGNRYVV